MTPQARYNREVRADPPHRKIEAERQSKRRKTKRYRSLNAAYQRAWRKRKIENRQ